LQFLRLIAFPCQHWLHECASMLCYTYFAYLVYLLYLAIRCETLGLHGSDYEDKFQSHRVSG